MAKLGDTVLYTADWKHDDGTRQVLPGIVTCVNSDGSFELCCFDYCEHKLEWYRGVRVTGAPAGTTEAVGKWSPR